MKMHAPNKLNADGSTYNAQDDPRITKIGKLLRERRYESDRAKSE